MYLRKKIRTRLIIVAVLVLAFIFWRGFKATTKDYNCSYKLIYSFCEAKVKNPKAPSIVDIFKAGVRWK